MYPIPKDYLDPQDILTLKRKVGELKEDREFYYLTKLDFLTLESLTKRLPESGTSKDPATLLRAASIILANSKHVKTVADLASCVAAGLALMVNEPALGRRVINSLPMTIKKDK